jgi:hypothetical protein
MFPNVRLMIVAVFASIVALSYGFGVFAAFRVNHEPFSRLPAGAPLQLVAENAAARPMTLVGGEFPGLRSPSDDGPIAAVAAGQSAADHDGLAAAVPSSAVAPVATVDATTAPSTSSAPEPTAEQAAVSDGQPAVSALTVPVAAAPAAGPDALPPQPPAADADAPPQQTQTPNVEQGEKTGDIADTTGALPDTAAPAPAANDRPPNQAKPIEQATTEPEVMALTPARTAEVHKVARHRSAPKPRRVAAVRGGTFGQFSGQNFPFVQPNFPFVQPNFQFAAQPAPQAAPQAAQRQVLLVTERRPAAKRAVAHAAAAKKTAVGGPFVRPPAQ